MRITPRQPATSRLLGPRALAVISCALALLAAQPLLASSHLTSSASQAPAIKIQTTDTTPIIPESPAIESTSAKKNRTAHQPTFLSSAHRLHILATVEILHRLLLAELRPAERQSVAAFLFEPQTLCTLAQPILTTRTPAVVPPIGLQRDRAFAIKHCLLAPPVL
ncbi:MAG TPA: hypothetical protein VM008_05355 [Phycisphaerae bacterium]|nr:hypothetical protein [Phycisphaerae bacterium]